MFEVSAQLIVCQPFFNIINSCPSTTACYHRHNHHHSSFFVSFPRADLFVALSELIILTASRCLHGE